jgi:hypothetical protein
VTCGETSDKDEFVVVSLEFISGATISNEDEGKFKIERDVLED